MLARGGGERARGEGPGVERAELLPCIRAAAAPSRPVQVVRAAFAFGQPGNGIAADWRKDGEDGSHFFAGLQFGKGRGECALLVLFGHFRKLDSRMPTA